MRVLSVNVARPRQVVWKGTAVSTGIYKEPVDGPVRVRTLNVDGDRQADLTVHGGWDKAVYAYPSEFYERWRQERPELDFPWGQFGENLTIEALLDGDVSVGDRFRVGTAELIVTQPRLPCFKLGIKMGRDAFVAEFLERGLLGFYFAVAWEGDVQAGDPIVELSRDPHGFRVTEVTRLYARDRDDVEGLQRAVALDALPESWRSYFRRRLATLERRRSRRFLPAAPAPAWPEFRPFVVGDKARESEDVCSFQLRPSDSAPLPPHRPGQYVTLRVPVPGSETPAIRSYSVAGSPSPDCYRLLVKREGVVSGLLHDELQSGDVVDVKAPSGRFTIDPAETYRPVVLVAGGIGITPILAMLDSIVARGQERETWLFYGVGNHREHLLREHLEEVAARHPFVRVHVSYSRPIRENGRLLGHLDHAGRISVELLRRLLPASYYDYFLCGPGTMMQSLGDGLRAWGVPEERIHAEAFGPAAIKAAVEPDAMRDCGIKVAFARSGTTTVWSRCDSPLLELAEDVGVSIPFGCRAGSCGTCVTQLVSGDVAYLYEPGAPLAAGEILPCVAVPETELVLDA
jgi:ferredoxin-NADP reductase/MOSC domain-containing protein YiiM